MVVFIIPGTLLFLGSHNASVAIPLPPILEVEEVEAPRTTGRGRACTQVFGGTCVFVVGVMIFTATIYVTVTGQM